MKRSEVAAYDVFLGIDVGKSSHYAVILDRDGDEPLAEGQIGQDEAEIRDLVRTAKRLGELLVAVDQHGAFGWLVVATARSEGVDVAHIPPRKFRQVADTYNEGKSDAKDAFIIADTARSQPRNLELVPERPDAMAQIKALSSARDDAVRERTRLYNRLHDLITQSCPALERVFTKRKLHNDLELRLIAKYGGRIGFLKAGRSRASKWAGSIKYHRNGGPAKVAEVFDAIASQSVEAPASEVLELQARKIADRLLELEIEEQAFNDEIERLSPSLPEVAILRSVPGVGPVFGAVIAAEIGDIARFPSPGHLASYGGVAPVKETSGTTVNKSRRRKGGNRRLKNAFIQSAQIASVLDGESKAYYERKRAEGKGHRQALRALARRHVDVIYALLTNGTYYEPQAIAG